MLAKIYKTEEVDVYKEIIVGAPDPQHISTSLVERQNLTLRMSSRRYTRRTNAFSKRLKNYCLAVALHFMYYNFIRIHQTLRMTPAMAASVTDTLHDMDWFCDLIDEAQPKPNRPKTYRKRT